MTLFQLQAREEGLCPVGIPDAEGGPGLASDEEFAARVEHGPPQEDLLEGVAEDVGGAQAEPREGTGRERAGALRVVVPVRIRSWPRLDRGGAPR